MIESRKDYLLDMIRRASEALAALLVEVAPAAKVDDEDRALGRALDDVFAGLDAHALQLDADTLRAVLRTDERALLFAILQARKGVRQLQVGDEAGADRLACARALLLRVTRGEPRLADVARPLARMLDAWCG